MIKLIDSTDKVLYETTHLCNAVRLFKIYTGNKVDVTEKEEILYGQAIYSEFTLPIEIHLEFKYKGVDDFNRPVFYSIDTGVYIGSTDKLINNESVDDVIEYFTNNTNELCIFGSKFNCEPSGENIGKLFKVRLIK